MKPVFKCDMVNRPNAERDIKLLMGDLRSTHSTAHGPQIETLTKIVELLSVHITELHKGQEELHEKIKEIGYEIRQGEAQDGVTSTGLNDGGSRGSVVRGKKVRGRKLVQGDGVESNAGRGPSSSGSISGRGG